MTDDRIVQAPAGSPRLARPLEEWDPRPRILISNDDGIESPGLTALREALAARDLGLARRLVAAAEVVRAEIDAEAGPRLAFLDHRIGAHAAKRASDLETAEDLTAALRRLDR